MSLPIICIDFDGVLHSYTQGWKGVDVAADGPVPGAIEWLSDLVDSGKVTVAIYSSRSKDPAGVACMRDWFLAHGMMGTVLDALNFPTQKPPAFLTIDDRAICFDGTFPSIETMPAFKPWNRREAIGGGALSALKGAYYALRSYENGNAAPALAKGAADALKEYFPDLRGLP